MEQSLYNSTEPIWLVGKSGRQYLYRVYPITECLPKEGGNFVLARVKPFGRWDMLFISQCQDLSNPCESGYLLPAETHLATHVFIHINQDDLRDRLEEAADLLKNYHPSSN